MSWTRKILYAAIVVLMAVALYLESIWIPEDHPGKGFIMAATSMSSLLLFWTIEFGKDNPRQVWLMMFFSIVTLLFLESC